MPEMPLRKAATGINGPNKYKKLSHNSQGQEDFIPDQFVKSPPKVPYRAIGLATVLFVGGSFLIIIGSMLLTGFIDTKYSDRTWPLLILGSIMFIPGAYHLRLAYYAYKGYQGYSFDDIPDYGE